MHYKTHSKRVRLSAMDLTSKSPTLNTNPLVTKGNLLDSKTSFENLFVLEKLLNVELQHHFNALFLRIYLEENLILRILRLICQTAFLYDDVLKIGMIIYTIVVKGY